MTINDRESSAYSQRAGLFLMPIWQPGHRPSCVAPERP
jgi:hypothetical protein